VLEADEARAAFLKKELYMGDGCSSSLNTERKKMLATKNTKTETRGWS
jgi:hypothetical protein